MAGGRAIARPTKCTGRCVSTGSTRTSQDDNPLIASNMPPETNATLKVMRWPYYFDQGVLDDFAKKYKCTVQVTEFDDMDKGLAKINSGQGDFDIMFGMNVWALGR